MALNSSRMTPRVTTILLLMALSMGKTVSAGIRGLGQGHSFISDPPVAQRFVYNPPDDGSPPSDVLALLASGRTSGTPSIFRSGNFVRQQPYNARSTVPFPKAVDFPTSHPSVDEVERFQTSSEINDSDYSVTSEWEPTKERVVDERTENASTQPLPNTENQFISYEDVVSNPDYLELPEYDQVPLHMETIIPDSSTKLADVEAMSTITTETIKGNMAGVSSSEVTEASEQINELPKITTIDGSNQEVILGPESQGETHPTSESPVELMTQDESEREITTHSPALAGTPAEKKNVKSGTKNQDEIKKEIHLKQKNQSQKQEQNDFEILSELLRQDEVKEEEKKQENKSKSNSHHNVNSIFFTIDETPTKDGQIRIKLGKALGHRSNKNTISKNENKPYQYFFQDPGTGSYKFGYGDTNQWRHEERRGDGVILGRYGWQDANGKTHTTHFVADAKGYRIVKPGQEIIMHVAAPPSTIMAHDHQSGMGDPTVLTTAKPFFTRKPTLPPSSPTAATFPITSLSTTFTLSTHPSTGSPSYPSTTRPADSFPGAVDELVRPSPDPSVVTGRPPIAYPLPHQSVSHRPGSWVFVSPTPYPSGTNRPFVRPPIRPFRPYPYRPIKSPFRPVNRPRPKPNRRRPLKPLQPDLHKGTKPQQSSDEEDGANDSDNPTLESSLDKDLIGKLQAFLNNPSKFLMTKPSQSQSDTPPVPNDFQFTSNLPEHADTNDTDELSHSEFLHFLQQVNSLKIPDQEAATSVGSPAWSVSPWSNNGLQRPQPQEPSGPLLPPTFLRPPPNPFLPTQVTSGSSVHEVFNSDHSQYPLDYAFMDEDYSTLDFNPNKPFNNDPQMQGFFDENGIPFPETLSLIPGAVAPTGSANPSTSNMNDEQPDDESGESDTWKVPVLVPLKIFSPQTTVTPQTNKSETSSSYEKLSSQNTHEPSLTTTSRSLSSTLAITWDESTTTTEVPLTENFGPYVTDLSSTPSTISPDNDTNPTPHPSANIWAELLNRIYYWPNKGPLKRPTIN